MIVHRLNSAEDGSPQIAKGAFGIIDIAVSCDKEIHKNESNYSFVALKTIHNALSPSFNTTSSDTNRHKLTPSVFAEMAALRVLSSDANKHDNVTELLSIITSSKTNYDNDITFVFPYCPIDLHQIILSHRFQIGTELSEINLPISIIRTAFRDILNGIQHIHSVGILHCDMKPGNVLLSSKGVFQLADFGLARLISPSHNEKGAILSNSTDTDTNTDTQPITGLCTLPYRPPEILFGSEDYQPSVDMWGAGLILCEMLCGRSLFYGVNVLDTLSRIINVLGTPTRKNWVGIEELRDFGKITFEPNEGVGLASVVNKIRDDAVLEHFVGRMVVMDPEKRYTPVDCLSDPWMQGNFCSRQDLLKLIPKDFTNEYDGFIIDDLDDAMKIHLLDQMKLAGAKIASAKRDFSFWEQGSNQPMKANDGCVEISNKVAGLLSNKLKSN